MISLTLNQAVYEFLLKKSRNNQWSVNTYKAYENDLKQWLLFMHNKNIFELNYDIANASGMYLKKLQDTKPSHTTYQRKKKVLKLFNQYCVQEYDTAILHIIAPEHSKRPINNAPITDKTILELLYSVGMNEEIICQLKVEHINIKTGVIQLHKFAYQLSVDSLDALQAWLSTKDIHSFLFPFNKKALKALLRQRVTKQIKCEDEDTQEIAFTPDYRMYHPRG
jgi:site-specific recombinase XerD